MPDTLYFRSPDLRTRPVEAAGTLIVFTPAKPKVHWLNLAGWYLFELSEGVTADAIAAQYADAVAVAERVPYDQAVSEARACLADLAERGILTTTA